MPKYVVSKTLEAAGWNNTTVLGGDVAEEVRRLKEEPGGDILVNGSAQLVGELQRQDLVDEYRLMVFPVVLGGGKRLFEDGAEQQALRVVGIELAGEVVILTLVPARDEGIPAADDS
jgi:dihydrofolate reductase